jgi:hypothetical protein
MRRHAPRHATQDENAGAIGISDSIRGEIVPRGVASTPAAIIPPQVSPYLPAYAPQTIATRPVYDMASPYPQLPDHVADQLTPGLADRTGWSLFQWMQDRHLFPALGVIVGDVCGWGAAATEPMHPWFGSVFLGFGILNGLAYTAIHAIRAINGDGEPLSAGAHVIGISGAALTAFGTACITGISFLSAGVTLIPGAGGYYAWFQNRQSRIREQRQFVVDYHTATTPALVPMPGGTPAAAPAIAGEIVSHEEQLVRRAFADMGIEPITLRGFERIDKDAFNVIVGLPGSATNDPESVVRRSEVLKNNLRARQIAVEAGSEQGNEVILMARFGEASPLLEVIPWEGPQHDDITKPIRMGLTHYGEPVMVNFAKRHTLFAGKTRRGKSAGVQVAVCSIGATRNAQLWLLDLKPGQLALGPFAALAAQFADSLPKAALLIAAAVAAMEENGEILKEERERTGEPVWEWDPAVHGAAIVIVVDELADFLRLDPSIYEMWLRLMQLGAGLGIYFVGATQSPSAKALGNSTDGGSQFGNIFGYQAKGATQAGVIFGQGAWGEGWKPSERNLPLQGMFMLRSPEHSHPVVSRGDFIQPSKAMKISDQIAQSPRAQLHPRTAAAVARVLAQGVPTGTGPDNGGGKAQPQDAPAYGRPRLVTLYPDGTKVDAKHETAWNVLGELGREGATVSGLVVAARRAGHEDLSLAKARDCCKIWRESGYVLFEEEGRDTRYWRDDEACKLRLRKEA